MTVPALPAVEALAQDLTHRISKPRSGWLKVLAAGSASSGRSALLDRLAGLVAGAGHVSLRVAPPPRYADTGPAAMLDLLGGLGDSGWWDGLDQQIRDVQAVPVGTLAYPSGRREAPPTTWDSVFALVKKVLNKLGKRAVLLCDEPDSWLGREGLEPAFEDRVRELLTWVYFRSRCHVICTVSPDFRRNVGFERLELPASSDPEAWLQDSRYWGQVLRGPAKSVWSQYGPSLAERSPLEVRLLVALRSLEADPTCQVLPTRADLARTLTEVLARDDRLSALHKLWGQLSLVRRPFDDRLLDRLEAHQLDDLSSSLLKRCLLYQQGSRWVLHDLLRADVRQDLEPELEAENVKTHGTLAAWYAHSGGLATNRTHSWSEVLASEVEALHHAARSGLHDRNLPVRIYFGEQLNALGRVLSRDFGLYEEATAIYRRSLAWREDDSYAHHYLAFNLHCQGLNAAEAEQHYREAIRLDVRNPRWHSRLVQFLVGRGRVKDAWSAWTRALDAMEDGNPVLSPAVYDNLHQWVATVMLKRAVLEEAEKVLRSVPPQARGSLPWWPRLWHVLQAYKEAEAHGSVVPAIYLVHHPGDWWSQGPFLVPRYPGDGWRLEKWLAARVAGVQGESVQAEACAIDPGATEHPQRGWTVLERSQLGSWSARRPLQPLETDDFFEVGFYRRDGETLVDLRVHSAPTWREPLLPTVTPDPDAYLRRGVQSVAH